MRRTVLALSFATLSLVTWLSPAVVAQETKSARGSVTAMTGDTITVKAGERELKFSVDAKTTVIASGGSTATRKATKAGEAGPKLADLVKVGDAVDVSYHEMGGTLHAASVRKVSATGSGGGSTSDERAAKAEERATGTVDMVSGTMLEINGSTSGGTSSSRLRSRRDQGRRDGRRHPAAAKGGKIAITEIVGKGDRVTVTYHKMGTTLHAAEVRVMQKSK